MYRLKYFERFSVGKTDVYYLCDDKDKRIAYKSGVYPRVEVNHDLREIVFYQIRDRERDFEINNNLFRLTRDTLVEVYEDYEVNIIRTQYNHMYLEWTENN